MNDIEKLVIGIDLGDSCLRAAVGRRNDQGKLELLALKRINGYTGMRRGVVHNVEQVTSHINRLINQLNQEIGFEGTIETVNVGLNAYTIHTKNLSTKLDLSGNERLTERHLDELNDQVIPLLPSELNVIDIIPQAYLLDGVVDSNPVGTMPRQVEAKYKVIVERADIQHNLTICFDSLQLTYEGILGPLAVAEAVLTPEERSKGVVLIDFGAQTTSVCIIKNELVSHIAILPFGSDNITKDLQQLNLDYQEAEQWKQEKGSAIYTLEEEEIADQSEESEVNQQQEFTKEANEIVVARIEEIVENIFAQIRYSGVELSKLRGGIVMAGGGSRLKELEKSVKNKITLPVRKADPSEIVASVPSEATVQLEDALCIGLLLLGKEGNFTPAPSNVAGTKTENKEEKVGELFEVEGVTAQPAENTQKVKKQSHKTGSKLKDLFGSLFNEEDL